LKKKSITFKYDRKTKKGILSVTGKKIAINVHNSVPTSGTGGYGLHLI